MPMHTDRTPAWRDKYPWAPQITVCDGLLPWVAEMLPPGARLDTQLARFRDAGFDHVSLTVAAGRDTARDALARLGAIRRELAGSGLPVRFARTRDEIARARADGVLGLSFHFQTATPFEPDLDLVDGFAAAGIGRAILAYNEANAFADGCHEPRNGGLTAAGRRLVRRMDQAGMVIDLSHCGERTSLDVLDMPLSRAPVFSHSNAAALFDHERNISDAQIRRCADRGGYVGVNGVGMFLGVAGPDIPLAMARQAAHIAGVAGPDHVGLGLDFMFLDGSDYGFFHAAAGRWPRGYPPPPWDFLQPEDLGALVDALAGVGFSGAEIGAILGGTYLEKGV
ncbi:MAG: membrane dipeptidase [Hyphomicrobiales bacterium]|nr:membrane dipeptidase [Hyphomicrobiales bacterium]